MHNGFLFELSNLVNYINFRMQNLPEILAVKLILSYVFFLNLSIGNTVSFSDFAYKWISESLLHEAIWVYLAWFWRLWSLKADMASGKVLAAATWCGGGHHLMDKHTSQRALSLCQDTKTLPKQHSTPWMDRLFLRIESSRLVHFLNTPALKVVSLGPVF